MTTLTRYFAIILVSLCLICGGCSSKSWNPSWQNAGKQTEGLNSDILLQEARAQFNAADNKEKVEKTITAYLAVLEQDSTNKEALTYVSNLYILLGTAYTDEIKEKEDFFHKAMRYAELAMYTNPAFKKEADAGKLPWEAAHTLTSDESQAMLFWVTALQYEFKECMSLPEKIINVKWLKHCIVFLDQIKATSPDFGNGAVEFAYTICYCALPGMLGGDEEKGIAYMEEAIAKSDGYLLPRWGRGKYFYQVTGDKGPSIVDLKWIAEQNPEEFNDAYPWKMHFIEDARLLLTHF